MTEHVFNSIGYLTSPFKEKFGVPRQGLLVKDADAVLKLHDNPSFLPAVKALEQFSHVWLLFVFHKTSSWHPLIDTPRIEASEKIGVFATRSPHRPNPLGMSVVKLKRIDVRAAGGIEIHLSGVDILDATPILDIKPYLPYADSVLDANAGWLSQPIDRFAVRFAEKCLLFFSNFRDGEKAKCLVEQMLELDPRPTSQRRSFPLFHSKSLGKKFSFRVLDFDVHWHVRDGMLEVYQINDLRKI